MNDKELDKELTTSEIKILIREEGISYTNENLNNFALFIESLLASAIDKYVLLEEQNGTSTAIVSDIEVEADIINQNASNPINRGLIATVKLKEEEEEEENEEEYII